MAKLSQCIICNCLFTEEVDDLLAKGMSYPIIVKFLKDKGINLSTQSVYRHNHKHRLANEKPKQIQKGKIRNAQSRARSRKKSTKKTVRADNKVIQATSPAVPRTHSERAKEIQYQKYLSRMKEDIDVIDEMLYVLSVSKDRVERALAEEQESGLVLATTGQAVKDYQQALAKFNEITSGMDSITQLRFAQLVNMVGNVFTQGPITDQTRHDLLQMMTEVEEKKKKQDAIEVEST